jgi:hypothetical protein
MSPASLKYKFPLIPIVLVGCCLVFSLAVYAIDAGRVQAASSGSTLTVPMPATQTSCPAAGTARPAVMNPLVLGKHQNVVYIYNEVPPNTSTAFGHLKRYDVTTKQKTVIVTSGLAIQRAQVSADGQWVLFLSTPDPRIDSQHSALFQLVRMDGKGLQTLYCSAASVQVSNIQWSVNQKFIIFDTTDSKTNVSTVTLLEVATAKLRTELETTNGQPNFRTVTWLDNKRVYVLRNAAQAPVETLYILDITKNKDIHGGDLQKVTDLVVLLTSWSLDSSFDATKLFLGECQSPENSRGSFSNIFVEPPAGGTQRMIYHDPTRCLDTLRAVTSTTLLFTDTAPGGNFGIGELWKIKPDGSGLTRLFDNGGAHTVVELNTFTQFPWSNVSRDGKMYTLDTHNPMGGEQDLLIGLLSGGKPKVFAFTTPGLVAIVGWTTM